jgi:hypothetical protein
MVYKRFVFSTMIIFLLLHGIITTNLSAKAESNTITSTSSSQGPVRFELSNNGLSKLLQLMLQQQQLLLQQQQLMLQMINGILFNSSNLPPSTTPPSIPNATTTIP